MAITGPDEGSLQRTLVGDVSHERGGRNIAKNVDDENVYRDRSGANVGADGINQGGIQRRSIQQAAETPRWQLPAPSLGPLENSATIITGTPSAMLTADTEVIERFGRGAAGGRPASLRPMTRQFHPPQ